MIHLTDRLQRIIDLLSQRMDDQAMQKGADAPHCVAVYGAFQTYAGSLERKIAAWPDPTTIGPDAVISRVAFYAAEARMLRRFVRSHAIIVRCAGRR